MISFHNISPWLNVGIFAVAAVIVWMAGTKVARYVDVIVDRTGMGQAFAGLLLLAVVTSMPEIATTLTAAWIGNAALASSNLLGGIAMQTAILAVVDLIVVRGALTYFSPRPVLLMQGVMLILLLAIVMAGVSVGGISHIGHVGLLPPLLAAIYLVSLWLSHRYEGRNSWQVRDPPHVGDHAIERHNAQAYESVSNTGLYTRFALGALVVLVAGWAVAQTGDALAVQTGLGATFVGATLVAIATSLPEASTTLTAARLGSYGMAISNIFGSNALMVALFLPADLVYTQGPILEEVRSPIAFSAAAGIIVTCIYLWGLLERRNKTVLGMGVDSLLVLISYLAIVGVLYWLRASL